MTGDLPVVARVFPSGCGRPGCAHHYEHVPPACACPAWPASYGGAHILAVNPLCPGHHTVTELIEDAANVLCHRDYLDPDADEIPADIAAELAELVREGPCELCPGWPGPDVLADHFLARKQAEWERSLPAWTCDCGAVYKPLTEYQHEQFYRARDDGLLGAIAGAIRMNAKGQVKHSDACPCGRKFADTRARRADPQQSLFDSFECAR